MKGNQHRDTGGIPKVLIVGPLWLILLPMEVVADENPWGDVKPALPAGMKEVDPEQMRLAKLIHQRIVEKKAKKSQFVPYTEVMRSGVEFQMRPIKAKLFQWKGQKDDVLTVTLDDFWMASTETTWAAYDAFQESSVEREKDGSVNSFVRPSIKDDYILLARPTQQDFPVTKGMPKKGFSAVGVTHHAANKFCQWLSYQTGHFYRLPTEAEWEYACRGGSDKKFSWGDDAQQASLHAWYGFKEGDDYRKPGLKKANGFGLYDMHGNVLEFTLDGYVENRRKHFNKDKVHNPWVRATQPYPHVTKGGHWKHPLEKIVASARIPSEPRWKRMDPQDPKSIWAFSNGPFIGFRVVRPVKLPTAQQMYYYWNSGTAYDGEMAVNEE